MTTLVSPISLMTLQSGLIYELQCQTNAEPDSLAFVIGSTTYNVTEQLVQNLMYISELTVTEFTGKDIIVHCNWNIGGASFTRSDAIEGKVVLVYLQAYSILLIIAPSLPTTVSLVNITTTSITINWTAVSNANGYVVYVNDTAYSVTGSDDITIDGLIPGTIYSITVRAYQDILGPASTRQHFTTNFGKLILANLINLTDTLFYSYYINHGYAYFTGN